MSTVPAAWAGAIAVISLLLFTVKEVASTPPKVTDEIMELKLGLKSTAVAARVAVGWGFVSPLPLAWP